jgi:hypothetical protein
MNDPKATSAIVNRHMARLLTDLEDAGCPVVFRDCVKSRMQWMRDDLQDVSGTKGTNDEPSKRDGGR